MHFLITEQRNCCGFECKFLHGRETNESIHSASTYIPKERKSDTTHANRKRRLSRQGYVINGGRNYKLNEGLSYNLIKIILFYINGWHH